MHGTQFHLLRIRRFLPLFVTQFLGALNDNLFKNALVILVLYRVAEAAGLDGRILVTVAAGAFILPFFLFSATAGQLADKFEKARLIRLIKLAEILIMALAVGAFLSGDPYLMLAVLFLMGTQSTFFGPLKGFDAVLSFMVERLIVPAAIIAATRPLNDDRNLFIISSAACRGKSWLGCLARGSDAGPRRG